MQTIHVWFPGTLSIFTKRKWHSYSSGNLAEKVLKNQQQIPGSSLISNWKKKLKLQRQSRKGRCEESKEKKIETKPWWRRSHQLHLVPRHSICYGRQCRKHIYEWKALNGTPSSSGPGHMYVCCTYSHQCIQDVSQTRFMLSPMFPLNKTASCLPAWPVCWRYLVEKQEKEEVTEISTVVLRKWSAFERFLFFDDGSGGRL